MSAIEHLDSALSVDGRTSFRMGVAHILSALTINEPAAFTKKLEALCSRAVYEQQLDSIECILSTDIRPRTSANPYGIKSIAPRTVQSRNATFTAICTAVTGKPPKRPVNKDTADWITRVDEVTAALGVLYQPYNSWYQATFMFLQSLRLMRHDELATDYFQRFEALKPERSTITAPRNAVLTKDEVSQIRSAIAQVSIDAMETGNESTVQAALAGLFVWGLSDRWQPQRRDCISYKFLRDSTDEHFDNFYDPSTGKLTINKANKVTLKEAVTIDIGAQCPQLRELLTQAAERTPCEYILFVRRPDGSCTPCSPSSLNYRLRSLFKTYKLEDRLCKAASSVNAARHYSVAVSRKRPLLSEEDRLAEKEEAKQRLSSVRMAEEVYAQDVQD